MTPRPRSGAAAESARLQQDHAEAWPRGATPSPEVRVGSREELPYVQGAVAAQVQEGREELLHVQGQEGRQ